MLGDGFLFLLLGNSMTAGALVAILMTTFMELTGSRRKRMVVELDMASLPKIDEFLRGYVAASGWNATAMERLVAVGEETLAVLLQTDDDTPASTARYLAVAARREGRSVKVEFVTALEGENLEDRLAYLSDLSAVPDEHEVSFRLLQHYASSVRHQKYHDVDIVTVHVEG